ncbi:MAG: hypothetical protein L0Y71_17840 [Gemmataceae bacterium]|nr:hypothetical protein [Gemmataceae bacterium]
MRCLVTASVVLILAPAAATAGEPDLTKAAPKDLGIEFVKPAKDDKTGFTVGGKNETAVIRKLTEINGRTIAQLEKDMRPGAKSQVGSRLGFLGKDEKLLDILAEDNDFVVGKLGLTHQELATHLHIVGAIGVKNAAAAGKDGFTFRYHGRRYRIAVVMATGFQQSPFYDDTRTNTNATLTNLTTGAKLGYSLLVPHMIERYGFYEGHGTPYRVDPRKVVEVFDFLTEKKK